MPSLRDEDRKTQTQLLAEVGALRHQLAAMLQTAQLDAESSEWFAVTLRSIGDAVLTTDTTANITFMNPEAERLTGWTLQEAWGHAVSDVLILRDEDPQQAKDDPVQRVLEEGRVVGLANHPLLVSRDGREIPIADSAAPIRGATGTLHGAVLVFRDVSKQVEVERILVSEKEAAEAADRMKSEFLATMSHELRTPLSVILGYTDIMINGACGEVTEESYGILGRVRHHVQAVTELITSMLDLSRVEAGRLPMHLQEVRVPTLLEELRNETREICEQSGLDIVWQGEQPLVSLYTDMGKLKIILKNLLGNAIKFTAQGRIIVQAQRRDAGVEFCVIDTGVGIPRDALALIFEPFRQVEGGNSHHGTGLGLHIVKRLVELLGGTVAVESEVGQGSTFRVWMPSGAPRLLTAGDRAESKETNNLKSL